MLERLNWLNSRFWGRKNLKCEFANKGTT